PWPPLVREGSPARLELQHRHDPTVPSPLVTAAAADDAQDYLARVRAAAAVRRLGHAIVGHDVAPDVLDELATDIESRLPALEAGAPRSRAVEIMKRNMIFDRPSDGERIGTFPDCVVSGDANPMGMAIGFYR